MPFVYLRNGGKAWYKIVIAKTVVNDQEKISTAANVKVERSFIRYIYRSVIQILLQSSIKNDW